jgi:hypothetical protein
MKFQQFSEYYERRFVCIDIHIKTQWYVIVESNTDGKKDTEKEKETKKERKKED